MPGLTMVNDSSGRRRSGVVDVSPNIGGKTIPNSFGREASHGKLHGNNVISIAISSCTIFLIDTSVSVVASQADNRTDRSSPQPLDISLALQSMHIDKDKRRSNDDSDEYEYGDTRGYRGHVSTGGSYDSDGDSPSDLTACDKECGYCGKCMY